MWLLMGITACADFLQERWGQQKLETIGRCEQEDDAVALFLDDDGDGFGDGTTPAAWGCLPVGGYVDVGGDCADDDPTRAPGQPETCNSLDDDCDLTVDEAPDRLWCQDLDGDDFGDPTVAAVHACESPGTEYVQECSDCDDDDASVGGGCPLE